jgi:4-methyl-5(b-hydroxyethyl)-thiazole monophosphate biosynthesis
VKDGHIVTAQGAGVAVAFGLKLAEIFVGKEKAEALSAGICYPEH